MLATIYQMSDNGRPTTPLRVPVEESGMRKRFTRNVALQSSEEVIPIIKSEPRKEKPSKGSTGRRSSSSVEPKARRRMTPTVEYAGYKDMMLRLQEDASDAIRTRTRDAIERQLPTPGTPPHEENTFSAQQHEENGRQDELPFFHGFNSTMEEPKRKYYAVRRGRTPGIYRTWDSCEKQVEGFSGCEFKSFKTKEGAHQYMMAGSPHQNLEDTDPDSETDLPTSRSRNVFEEGYVQHSMRNDAVGPIPGTVLRRNVTQR